MTHDEIVNLIRIGVRVSNGTWADIGAGNGNFTLALRDLLGEQGTIYAVDRDKDALFQLARRVASPLHVIVGDFTQPLDLPKLDGIVMANALHWVGNQQQVLKQLTDYLKPDGHMILVEYDVAVPRPYIPRPVSYQRFETLAKAIGLREVQKIGERHSRNGGISMYAGMGLKYVVPD